MVKVKKAPPPHEGAYLKAVHHNSNARKATAYWLGFLRGVLASNGIEAREFGPLRIESEKFLANFHDEDAADLVSDLDITWKDRPSEIYAIVEDIVSWRSQAFAIETDKDEINEFYGFCAGIACDNTIMHGEVERLITRVESSDSLKANSRVRQLGYAATLAIADGRITEEESDEICDWITRLVGDSASDTGIATFGNVGVIDGSLRDPSQIDFDETMFVLWSGPLGPDKIRRHL